MKKLVMLIYMATTIFFLSGCATNLTSKIAPDTNLDELGNIFVVRFEPDKRGLNRIIADQLSLMGYPVQAGEEDEISEDVDTLVTYVDNWQWDLSNYMIKINIQLRDRKTNKVIAIGESFRTSLVRKSPEDMIAETLEEIFKNKGL